MHPIPSQCYVDVALIMAKKRKSSPGPEAEAEAEAEASAALLHDTDDTRSLEADLDRLCKDAQINVNIPYGQQASPPKHGRDSVWKTYKFLWFKNKPGLDEAVKDYLKYLPLRPLLDDPNRSGRSKNFSLS